MAEINSIIDALGLLPHPEGGHYQEVHRSKNVIRESNGGQDKSAYTSIYYLLSGKDFSSWHRIKSEETWYFHLGCDVQIYFFDENALLQTIQLGIDTNIFQATVPANTWFAAKPVSKNDFCLVSCAVAPGFEFSDFEIASRDQLLKEFGKSTESIQLIQDLTRA
jgi:predicted cupin superfamily sugar epimerase